MTLTQDTRNLQVTTPAGTDFLLLNEFFASENISELFSFQLELVHEENSPDTPPTIVEPEKMLGQTICTKITLADKTNRCFHGVVSHWQQSGRTRRFTYYRAIVVPRIWILTQRCQSRIFQRMTVPEILEKMLTGFDVKFELVGSFSKRDYCVQYQETDFAFISRLMEEEGIYYFFKHSKNKHLMIVANTPQSHRDCPSKSKIPFAVNVTDEEYFVSSVRSMEINYRLQTGKITVWDHNFELPHKHLDADQTSLFQVGGNSQLEQFLHTGDYAKRYTGVNKARGDQNSELEHIFQDNREQARYRMEAIDANYKIFTGSSDCCSLTAGHCFQLFNHLSDKYNIKYVLTRVAHHAVQSPSLETGEESPSSYTNQFDCIQFDGAPYRPQRKTSKPKVLGSQTAVVVGPSGEEIYTDKYGRIKVQFHWDREGKRNIDSSCWIRVSQPWAGRNWGTICIPRIGQEVIVDFIEGDPDRPIVTGSVYNPDQMPPYELPSNAHTMGFKSNTTKGGGGYNEIVIVDGKSGELIRLHAQKDMDTTVLNDDRQHVVNNRNILVTGTHTETVKKDMTTTVTEGNQANTVKLGNQTNVTAAGSHSNTAAIQNVMAVGSDGEAGCSFSGSVTIKNDGTIDVNAVTKITLHVGGSSITIEPDHIVIKSAMVDINP